MSKPSCLISIPTTGWVHKAHLACVMHLAADDRVRATILPRTAVPLENNLNGIVKLVLDGGHDFWLNIDADNAPTKNPLDLIDLNLDIVGLPYPSIKFDGEPSHWPVFWSAFDFDEDACGYREHGHKEGDRPLQEVDAVGSGCMLVSRRVLEGLRHPFSRLYDDDGLVIRGVDMQFCARAKAAGFQVWAHYGYPARHFKEVDLLELIKAFNHKLEACGG